MERSGAHAPELGPGWLSNTHPALRSSWLPVARSAAVTDSPRRVLLLGEPLVAFRSGGAPVVLLDRCPHRFAPLSAGTVADGSIRCAYHGWRFAPDGRCLEVPSLRPDVPVPANAFVGALASAERDGIVYAAFDDPLMPLPEPTLGGPLEHRFELDAPPGRYGAAQLIDNQLDLAHFAFVHETTFGASESRQVPRVELAVDEWGFSAEMTVPIAARHDPSVAAGQRPLLQERRMRYRYQAPFFVELELTYLATGGRTTIAFAAQPETAGTASMYCTVRFEQPGGFSPEELVGRVAFEQKVIDQDLELQRRFDVLALPVELSVESHVQADRQSLEFRRILARLIEQAEARRAFGPLVDSAVPVARVGAS